MSSNTTDKNINSNQAIHQVIVSVFDNEKDGSISLGGLPDYAIYSTEGMKHNAQFINLAKVTEDVHSKVEADIKKNNCNIPEAEKQSIVKKVEGSIDSYKQKYTQPFYTDEVLVQKSLLAFQNCDKDKIVDNFCKAIEINKLCKNENFRQKMIYDGLLDVVKFGEPGQLDYEYALFDFYAREQVLKQVKNAIANIAEKQGQEHEINLKIEGPGTDPNVHLNGTDEGYAVKVPVLKLLADPKFLSAITLYSKELGVKVNFITHFTCGSEQAHLFYNRQFELACTKEAFYDQILQSNVMGRKSVGNVQMLEQKLNSSKATNNTLKHKHLCDISSPDKDGKKDPNMITIKIDEVTNVNVPVNCEHAQYIKPNAKSDDFKFEVYGAKSNKEKHLQTFTYDLSKKLAPRLDLNESSDEEMVHAHLDIYTYYDFSKRKNKSNVILSTQHHFNGGGIGSQLVNNYIESSLLEFSKWFDNNLETLPQDSFAKDGRILASKLEGNKQFQHHLSLLKAKLAKAHYMALEQVDGFKAFYSSEATKNTLSTIDAKVQEYEDKIQTFKKKFDAKNAQIVSDVLNMGPIFDGISNKPSQQLKPTDEKAANKIAKTNEEPAKSKVINSTIAFGNKDLKREQGKDKPAYKIDVKKDAKQPFRNTLLNAPTQTSTGLFVTQPNSSSGRSFKF